MPYHISKENLAKLVIKQQYDANASFKNLFAFTGTCLQEVFNNFTFWLLVAIHVALYAAKVVGKCSEGDIICPFEGARPAGGCCTPFKDHLRHAPLKLGDISMVGQFATFFLVFYSGNCYARYSALYSSVIAMQGKLHNISLYLRVSL